MKVILLQNVKGKGKKGEIIEVSDGYAQNALLPKGLAKVATNTEINKIAQSKKSEQLKDQKDKEHALRVLGLMQGKTIVIKERLNEKGSLYHAIGTKDISGAIIDQIKITVPSDFYVEKYALKDSGDYIINIQSHGEKSSFNLKIESE